MTSHLKKLVGAAAMAGLIMTAPGLACAQELQGLIVSHDGNQLVVRVGAADTTVNLTDATTIQSVSGPLGINKDTRPASDLINGLAVKIETATNGDASKITFKPDDLKTAQAVQAGVDQAKQRAVAAQAQNNERFAAGRKQLEDDQRRLALVGQFSEKGHQRVLFATGSAAINADGKAALQAIANQAATTPGAVIRVVGHADSTGNAAANQRLSDQRASAVTAYLLRTLNVAPEKILSAGGLGSYVPIDDDTTGGLAQNRRVTVFVLVSKASEIQTSAPAPYAPTSAPYTPTAP